MTVVMGSRRVQVAITGSGGSTANQLRPELRHETLRELYAQCRDQDLTNREVAALLGISEGMAARDRRDLGLSRGNGGRLRRERAGQGRARLAADYAKWAAEDLYAREIAAMLGVTAEEARRDLKVLGLSRGHGPSTATSI
jgi:hypothetical protein